MTTIVTPTPTSTLAFARHHGYHLREQWLSKGLLALREAEHRGDTQRVFAHPEATDQFAIGPGMVAALRFWLQATGLMCETRREGQARLPMLTGLGRLMVLHDPFLERLGSLWLLHLHLTRNLVLAPTWFWFFQLYAGRACFSRVQAQEALFLWAVKVAPNQQMGRARLNQDLACLLRMTVPNRLLTSPEVLTTSPFQRLGLLHFLPDTPGQPGRYGFQSPQAEEVHPLVWLAALLLHSGAGGTVPLSAVLHEPLHAGCSLGLAPTVTLELLARLQQEYPAWSPQRFRQGAQEMLSLPKVAALEVMEQSYLQPA